eukprot:SAG22_NODE_631_length_8376_cov_43.396037_7_plen_636_part_00
MSLANSRPVHFQHGSTMLEPSLHSAAEEGKLEEITKLLQNRGLDPHAPDHSTGETALHKACAFGARLGDAGQVRRCHRQDVIEHGTRRMLGMDKLDQRRPNDRRPRTQDGFDPAVVNEGLRPGNVAGTSQGNGMAAAVPASGHGRLAVVKALLAAGLDPNVPGRFGYTPLHYACWRGHPRIVAALLEAGADPGARTGRRTGSHLPAGSARSVGDTPSDLAARVGHRDCVQAIDAHVAGSHYGLSRVQHQPGLPGGGGQFKKVETGRRPAAGGGQSAERVGRKSANWDSTVWPAAAAEQQQQQQPPPPSQQQQQRQQQPKSRGGDQRGSSQVGGLLADGNAAEFAPERAAAVPRTPGPPKPRLYTFMGVEAGAERTLSVRRQTLPSSRGEYEAHAAHAADDGHAAGNQNAAWPGRTAGGGGGGGGGGFVDPMGSGAGWQQAHAGMPPGSRVSAVVAARAHEPVGLGQKGLHPETAHLKLRPTAALTQLNKREYRTAGALLGEQPVTAKPGAVSASGERPGLDGRGWTRLERHAVHRPTGYAYDAESGKQALDVHYRPAYPEEAVAAVKGTNRYTTDYPGKAYTHTAALKGAGGATGTYQVPGQHVAWGAPGRPGAIYELGKPGPRKPVGEAQAAGR